MLDSGDSMCKCPVVKRMLPANEESKGDRGGHVMGNRAGEVASGHTV